MSDYRVQILATWSGESKEHFGLFLHLHRGHDNHGNHDDNNGVKEDTTLELFDGRYTFEIRDGEGNRCYDTMTRDEIAEHRDECFTVHPGERCVRKGYGGRFISYPLLEKYVVGDALTVRCIFELFSTP